MLRGKVEVEMALLSEGSSVKESPEDKQASAPGVRGSTLMWGAHIFCKIRAGAKIFRWVRIFCYTRDIKADWHTLKEITGKYHEKIPSEINGTLQK